ncbi:MAG: SsrA-binding protein SmpB [Candidatus Babeliaceae bacterium]|jgi:SsrA-binding protein
MKIIANNKKAFFEYEILDHLEAGMVLTGNEVKALRAGHANLTGAFAVIHDGELTLINCHISPYSHAYNKDEDLTRRTRKLLVHKKQLNKLVGDIARKGITLVPLKLYFNERGRVKVDLGIAKHKKAHERKEVIKERDIARQTRRELKGI